VDDHTHQINEIKCPTIINDFTVVYFVTQVHTEDIEKQAEEDLPMLICKTFKVMPLCTVPQNF